MKKIFALCLILMLVFSSCEDDVTSNGEDRNLISNPSFELDGSGSLRGWESAGNINFYRDTPPGGGTFSIGISETQGPSGYVVTKIPFSRGSIVYNFRCWAKADKLPGEIHITVERDSLIYSISREVIDTVWTMYSITDSVNFTQSDSLRIYLKGSISQLLPAKTYYDNCYLEIN